jgi:hypothetical protein
MKFKEFEAASKGLSEKRVYTSVEIEKKSKEVLWEMGIRNPTGEQVGTIVDAIKKAVSEHGTIM